jgi:hypothetical protein
MARGITWQSPLLGESQEDQFGKSLRMLYLFKFGLHLHVAFYGTGLQTWI